MDYVLQAMKELSDSLSKMAKDLLNENWNLKQDKHSLQKEINDLRKQLDKQTKIIQSLERDKAKLNMDIKSYQRKVSILKQKIYTSRKKH